MVTSTFSLNLSTLLHPSESNRDFLEGQMFNAGPDPDIKVDPRKAGGRCPFCNSDRGQYMYGQNWKSKKLEYFCEQCFTAYQEGDWDKSPHAPRKKFVDQCNTHGGQHVSGTGFGADSDSWWLNWSAVEEAFVSGPGKDPEGTLG
eukprot:g19196.t1